MDDLEKDGKGLNLTHEVRMGILNHSKGKGRVSGLPRGRGYDPGGPAGALRRHHGLCGP